MRCMWKRWTVNFRQFSGELGTLFMEPNIMADNVGAIDSTALPEEARQCNPSLPIEMEDIATKMRGDAIGNTLYSECWVIKVLMKLAKFCSEDWSEDTEKELCLLWDMTVEADVAELLMRHDFLDLASRIIHDTTIHRLMEILVGIIGNLSCVASVRVEIARKVNIIHMLLKLLSLPDVPTLLQLMRLLQACVLDLVYAGAKAGSCGAPMEQSVQHENKTNSLTEPEIVIECSKSAVSPSFQLRVDEKVHECSSYVANIKCVENTDNISKEKSVQHDKLDEVSQHLQSCTVDVDRLRLERSCALHEADREEKLRVIESRVLEVDEADCENGSMRDNNDKQLELNEDISKEKSEVDSLWLQELCDVNKWLPSIIFILRSSTNEELICGTLSLLDMLCYIRINGGLLGIHIASPEIVLALVETFEQLQHGYTRDDDLCPDVKLEKAVCDWTSILSCFTSFPAGKVALGCYAETLCTCLCKHLVVDKLSDKPREHQAEFIVSAAAVVRSLLEDVGYFHPPSFNCFLSILTCLKGRSALERSGCDSDGEKRIFSRSIPFEVQQEVIADLEKYFVAVVQRADGGALASLLQHCNKEHVAILQSVMEGQKSAQKLQ